MQRIVLYQHETELYTLSFLHEQHLPTLVICPNPQLADLLTSLLPSQPTVTCLTISKFLSQNLAEIDQNISILRKADFIAHLGTIFRQYFPQATLECFFQSFNLFTELRSFTLDINLIKEILPSFDAVVGQAIEVFWHYCNHIDLVDEHRGYQILSEAYRQIDHPFVDLSHHRAPVKNIVVWGFTHLSAGQIDLLKSLAIYNDVFIPIPRAVYSASRPTDWIRWLSDLPQCEDRAENRIIDCLKICYFPRNRLAETLSDYQSSFAKSRHYYLSTSKPELEQLFEIPEGEANYRASADIFTEAILHVRDAIRLIRDNESEMDLVEAKIEMIMREVISKGNYRELKIWQLYRQQIQEWQELSDKNTNLTDFDIGLIDHIVELNTPRVFTRPLVECSEYDVAITGIEGLAFHRQGVQPIICVTSSYPSLRVNREKYSPDVSQFLAVLGPIRRGEFDYAWLNYQLHEVLQQPSATLFIESGVVERDMAWEEIVSAVRSIELLPTKVKKFSLPDDFLAVSLDKPHIMKYRSATRIQSYQDCPRKYYYNYIMPLKCNDGLSIGLSPAELGELEHQAIALYMQAGYAYDEERLRAIVQKQFVAFDANHPLVDKLDRADYQQEVFLYARNAVRVLCRFAKIHPQLKINFECPLSGNKQAVGRIDCLIEIDQFLILLDFKRSANSIPTMKDISEFRSLQLWFYLNHLGLNTSNVILFGYLNLSDIGDSLLFAPQEEYFNFYQEQDVIDQGALKLFKDDFNDALFQYQVFEDELIKTIESDCKFAPCPESDSTCLFCQLSNICPRFIYDQNT